MLNGRLYRVAFVPFLIALAVAAFSLGARPAPLTSTLAPDAFQGPRAFSELRRLSLLAPARRPGGAGDEALAAAVARTIEGLGGTGGGGFAVRTVRSQGQTIDGQRTLTTVVAERPGSTDASPIVLVAHRDAAARPSWAELSGTAALLELARVFASRETKRPIVLVSTSGGSGGDAGAAALAGALHGPVDAAIVLGDLAGTRVQRPFVVPYSDGYGSAPLQLQRTVADAIQRENGWDPGAPSPLGQLAHLTFPFATGEQGVLTAAGIPAVLVQGEGERGPSAREPVSAARMEGFGRAVVSAVDALDVSPDASHATQTGIGLARKTLPEWAVRLLAGTLLIPVLIAIVDGLARMRRRRIAPGRWVLWTLSCALPFLCAALLCAVLGLLGIVPAPGVPVSPGAMPLDGQAVTAVAAVGLTFALAWLLWGSLLRRLGWTRSPDPEAAGLAALAVLAVLGTLVWLANPYAALLAIPALHVWLAVADPDLRPRPWAALALVAVGALPLVALLSFYAHQLGMGVGDVAWSGVLLVAGGHVGFFGVVLWSVAFGCLAAAAMVALTPPPLPSLPASPERVEITIRGPLSYAGPGSLGGTESALRR